LSWSEVDDITTSGVRDPHCVEHPENVYRWLVSEASRADPWRAPC
jgi:hypothetical protein